jgi:hypothetical protein
MDCVATPNAPSSGSRLWGFTIVNQQEPINNSVGAIELASPVIRGKNEKEQMVF